MHDKSQTKNKQPETCQQLKRDSSPDNKTKIVFMNKIMGSHVTAENVQGICPRIQKSWELKFETSSLVFELG